MFEPSWEKLPNNMEELLFIMCLKKGKFAAYKLDKRKKQWKRQILLKEY